MLDRIDILPTGNKSLGIPNMDCGLPSGKCRPADDCSPRELSGLPIKCWVAVKRKGKVKDTK